MMSISYEILFETREGKRLRSPRRTCSDNIKMNLQEEDCKIMNWIHLAQDRDQWRALVNMVIKASGSIKGEEFLDYIIGSIIELIKIFLLPTFRSSL
jgi:hypothetical protein